MLIVLLKKLAIPGPIIGVAAAVLVRFKRSRQHGNAPTPSGPSTPGSSTT
jgi:hypothetical protein